MANYSTTYSGDFTSFVAGKLFSAAGMAKQEKERREQQGLEKASPGSLFARALQHEFGGDLYNRTLGTFDPRKSHKETDRKSSKESRFKAQFPEGEKKTSKSSPDIDNAAKELLSDDDKESIPVKDKDLREFVSKVFGAGIDAKLVRSEGRITNLSSQVYSVSQSLVDTQKLILNQNEVLEAKFDQILQIFNKQSEYQKKIADEAEVRRRETELEQTQDLSRTRGYEEISTGDASSSLFGKLLSLAFRRLLKKRTKSIIGVAKNIIRKALLSRSGRIAGFGAGAASQLTGKTGRINRAAGRTAKQLLDSRRIARAATSKPVGKTKQLTNIGNKRSAAADALRDFRADKSLRSREAQAGLDLLTGKDGPKIISNIGQMKGMDQAEKMTAFDRLASGKNIEKKSVQKATSSLEQKVATKVATQKGAKTLAKGFGKFIPFAGTAIALGEAAYRANQGDKVGAALSLGSAIPILGWGFTAIDIARDLGAFGGATPYETGTGMTKRGPAVMHGTEAVIGRSDRENAIEGYKKSMHEIGSSLVSASVALGEASGTSGEVRSEIKKSGIDYDIVNLPLSSDIGKISNLARLKQVTTPMEAEEKIPSLSEKDKEKKGGKKSPKEPPPGNKKLEDFPEYDLDNNAPNSVVRLGGKLYKTNADGAIVGNPISLAEANQLTAPPPPATPPPGGSGNPGSYASGTYIGPTGDRDGQQTGLNMNLPGGIGTPIYAPIDLIYKSRGTDGMPSVGLDGTPDVRGPQGKGFGYYGAYYFEKDGKQYEVLLGHFRSLPYKGSSEGQKIPKGTLLGYQGASGRSISRDNGPYPHISLHVNGVGFRAGNDVLTWFADGLAGGSISTGNGGGGGGGGLSRHQKALLKTISFAEGTTGSYGTIFGGRVIPELERGEMTVREVYNMMMTGKVRGRNAGYSSGSYATGRYQFMPDTIKDIVEKYKDLRWGEKFTKEAQDRAILSRLENFRGVSGSLLQQQGLSNDVLDMLSGEFASFPTYAGVSAYGQPVKSQEKLRQMYNQYLNTPAGPAKVGPKIVGPKIVGPGRVGSGIPLVPDLTIQNFMRAIQKGWSDGIDDGRKTFEGGVIPRKSSKLQSNSQIMEDMEDQNMVAQQIFIINQQNISSEPLIISRDSGSTESNFSDDYFMAVLGA